MEVSITVSFDELYENVCAMKDEGMDIVAVSISDDEGLCLNLSAYSKERPDDEVVFDFIDAVDSD